MTDVQQRAAAKDFTKYWTGRGDEKQETQRFWIDLLRNVYGVEEPEKAIEFEYPVKLDHVSFIDGYIRETRVLIEQKGADIDLRRGYKQSDGSMLTPYQQARRYVGYLPYDMNPRWIVVCNFREFHIHDMNRPNDEPEVVALDELEKEYHRLNFLVDTGNENIKKEMEVSLKSSEIVGILYDALLKQYKDPESPETLKSLNTLCVFGSYSVCTPRMRRFSADMVNSTTICNGTRTMPDALLLTCLRCWIQSRKPETPIWMTIWPHFPMSTVVCLRMRISLSPGWMKTS